MKGSKRPTFLLVLLVLWGSPSRAAIEVAEELLVDLDASDDTAGDDFWTNNGTLDDFQRFGMPQRVEIRGVPAVLFAGGGPDAYQCLEEAPQGVIGLDPTRSIEVWVYNEDIAAEETMVAWGMRGGPCGTNMSFNYGTDPNFGAVGHWCWDAQDLGWASVPIAGQWHYLVYTYDGTATRVYAEGVENNFEVLGPGAINTHGGTPITLAAQYEADGVTLNTALAGTLALAKVRVHDGVLTPEQIRNNYEAEKDQFPVDAVVPVFRNAPQEDTYMADSATYTFLLLVDGFPPPVLEVLEPAGATITPQGRLTYQIPDPPPSEFTVRVQATNAGGTAEASWVVRRKGLPPQGQLAIAGELFVDLDATDDTAGDDEWVNNGTLENFLRKGDPQRTEIEGVTAVNFAGVRVGPDPDSYQCLEPAPDGLVGPDPTRTIEVWAYNESISNEETMVAWGKRGGPDGTNMSFNYGTNALFGAVGHWGQPHDAGWGPVVPAPGQWHHLVYTFDGNATRVYSDGELYNEEVIGPGLIDTFVGTPITLAAQINDDGVTLNTALAGTLALARVRVHDGVLSPEEIRHNFEQERADFGIIEAPPQFTDIPEFDYFYAEQDTYTRTVTVEAFPEATVEVLEPAGGNFDTQTGIFTYDVPSPPPTSFTVRLRAANSAGSTEASWEVRQVTPQELTAGPVHRWSFTSDASDSVGGADGIAYGDVIFQDGQAVLGNPTAPPSNAADPFPDPLLPDKIPPGAYIDLPNGVISALSPQATFEAWVTWNGPVGSSWQRIFDFGTSVGGENFSSGGGTTFYIFLTPRSGANTLRFGYRNGPPAVERGIETARLADGSEQHVAVTWNEDTYTAELYLNGVRVDRDTAIHISLADILDDNNWLGRSQFIDPMFNGSYNEFRIYDRALSPPEILGNFHAGPDIVNTEGVGEPVFLRGDANADGGVNIADAVSVLNFLFGGGEDPVCMDTADGNDDGGVNIADAVSILNHLFGGAGDLPPPFGACGTDPTPDQLPECAYPSERCP